MITVELPDTYRSERIYVLDFVLKQVLGLVYEVSFNAEGLGRGVRINLPNSSAIQLSDVLFQTPEDQWLDGQVIPDSPLPRINVAEPAVEQLADSELPVMFPGPQFHEHSSAWEDDSPDSIRIHFDLLGAVFFMLTRYEEVASPYTDGHQRFDSARSVAVRNRFEARPLADEYVALLGFFIAKLDPSVDLKKNSYSVSLTHDLDRPYLFTSITSFFKGLAGHVLKRRDFRLALEWLKQGILRSRGPEYDPFFRGMLRLLSVSEKYGLRSQINLMASQGGPHDDGYDPGIAPLSDMLIGAEVRGHVLGFHPGYSTYSDPLLFSEEKVRLEKNLNRKVDRIRQHYLRMEVPGTWELWEENNISRDGTVGFPDRNGFRAGTCQTYPLYDLKKRRELTVWETPLIVMDGALRAGFNEGLEPAQAIAKANRLSSLCKKYGGTFSLLWHNSSFTGDWVGWESVYESIVKHSVELLDE